MKGKYQPYLFIAPAFILLIATLGFPAFVAVTQSFGIFVRDQGIGLQNYLKLAADPVFHETLLNTVQFVAGTVLFHFLLGLSVALVLNMDIRARRFWRIIALLPWTVPDVISGLIWKFMLAPLSGIVNEVLSRLHLISDPIRWLSNPQLALPSVISAEIWRGYPFVMLILLAGLQAIPQRLYEAAEIDGASVFQRFRYITIPHLRTMILIALALDTIWQARRFGAIYNMTYGGPGHASEVLSLFTYKHYFQYFNYGYASAIAVTLATMMFIVSYPYLKTSMRRE